MIKTEGLTKHYGGFCALKDLNIHILKGQIFGYIGPNGSGKTTTIRILAGLMKPSKGHAYIGGVDVSQNASKVKELIGYLPDFIGVYEGMRVQEYLDFFGAAFKIPRKERRKRIDYVLELTGSAYMKDLFVEALSRGMRQRVGIARTLLHDPAVLLLDEPLNALDPKARVEMKELMRKLSELGKTILVSSHILPELAQICDIVAILDHGTLHAFGPVEAVMRGIRQARLAEIHVLDNAAGVEELLKLSSQLYEISHVQREGKIVRFEWNASDEQLSKLLAVLMEKGFKILWFQEVPVSLEEAFMHLTELAPLE